MLGSFKTSLIPFRVLRTLIFACFGLSTLYFFWFFWSFWSSKFSTYVLLSSGTMNGKRQ